MADEVQYQLVTFKLGEELYGVDIMDVKEIVKLQEVRLIPNAPFYVEGIINLRGEIIPIIDLHKRFRIQKTVASQDDLQDAGFLILHIQNNKIGIINTTNFFQTSKINIYIVFFYHCKMINTIDIIIIKNTTRQLKISF